MHKLTAWDGEVANVTTRNVSDMVEVDEDFSLLLLLPRIVVVKYPVAYLLGVVPKGILFQGSLSYFHHLEPYDCSWKRKLLPRPSQPACFNFAVAQGSLCDADNSVHC